MAAPADFEKLELQPIEHLGLVAGLIQKYDLVKLLDKQLPVSKEKGIKAEHLNDDALGRILDAIYAQGCTSLFSDIAFQIMSKHQLIGQSAKLDTTSLKLFGEYYDVEEKNGKKPPQPAFGYSKDHRPDLKQVVMHLNRCPIVHKPIFELTLESS
jgi:transposase